MAFDLTITLSAILTLVGMGLGAVGLYVMIRLMLKEFGMRLMGLEKATAAQGSEIVELRKMITTIAVQNERLNAIDRRLEDLSHGRGFVREAFPHLGRDT